MLFPLEYEQRMADFGREVTRDIKVCEDADIAVVMVQGVPFLRFVFGEPWQFARPHLAVQLVTISKKNPLAPGRILEAGSDELRRYIRNRVEAYLKIQGVPEARKVTEHACL